VLNTKSANRAVWRHLLANVLGRSWGFVSTFLMVPVYVHLLGIQNFGVVALFLVISGVVAFLDLGLSPTLARELHDQRRDTQYKINLLFTYELVYAGMMAIVALFAGLAPNRVFSILVSQQDLLRPEVMRSVSVVFFAAAAQMLFNFYVAGLMGVEEQIKGNFVVVTAGIARNAAVIIPLWLYPKPIVFIMWSASFSLGFAGLSRYFLYRAIRRGREAHRPVFSLRMITDNVDFTAGMFLVAATSSIVTQIDKLFISRVMGIDSLARYSLVSTFAQLIVFAVSPITLTLLPRLVYGASGGDTEGVRATLMTAHRLVSASVCSAIGGMLYFGPYLIGVWTGGKVDSASIGGYVGQLIVGYAFVALGTVPHSIAVANKSLKPILLLGGAGALFAIPAYWYSINSFGLAGAATTWLLLQLFIYPSYVYWVNRQFIRLGSLGDVALRTLVVPTAGTLAISCIASRFLSDANGMPENLSIIALALVAGTCLCFVIIMRRADVNYLFGAAK